MASSEATVAGPAVDSEFPPVIEGLKVHYRLNGDRLGGAVWTVGPVTGDWTTIAEWEATRRLNRASRSAFFVPDFWKSFAPAE